MNISELGYTLIDRGEAMATLGLALQNPKTTISRLIELADIAGLEIGVDIVPRELADDAVEGVEQ